jgi:hypothetical protein
MNMASQIKKILGTIAQVFSTISPKVSLETQSKPTRDVRRRVKGDRISEAEEKLGELPVFEPKAFGRLGNWLISSPLTNAKPGHSGCKLLMKPIIATLECLSSDLVHVVMLAGSAGSHDASHANISPDQQRRR